MKKGRSVRKRTEGGQGGGLVLLIGEIGKKGLYYEER